MAGVEYTGQLCGACDQSLCDIDWTYASTIDIRAGSSLSQSSCQWNWTTYLGDRERYAGACGVAASTPVIKKPTSGSVLFRTFTDICCPDTCPDPGTYAGPDPGTYAGPDTGPDICPDPVAYAGPDIWSDTCPDSGPDTRPDPCPDFCTYAGTDICSDSCPDPSTYAGTDICPDPSTYAGTDICADSCPDPSTYAGPGSSCAPVR